MSRKSNAAKATNAAAAEALTSPGRFNYEGLERTFHEKARLGIMTSLVIHADGLSFNDLKELCALSDGNLNRHIEVLREADCVRVEKVGGGRGAKTTCYATLQGTRMFQAYLAELERVIQDAAQAAANSTSKSALQLGLN